VPESRVVDQVRLWRDDLLSLTRNSNLLYFRHLKVGSLEITRPTPEIIVSRLTQPRSPGWVFQAVARDEEADAGSITEVLTVADRGEESDAAIAPGTGAMSTVSTTKASARDLAASLRTLHRSSTQEFLDKGIWILYLGLGMLEWEDPEDHRSASSPLLFVPVRLDRPSPRELFHLVLSEGEMVFNPALALKLETDFGIVFPEVDTDANVSDVLDAVANAVADQPRWSVQPRTVLARFSFQKEVMYQDLRRNEEVIASHQLIESLARAPSAEGGGFSFHPVPEHSLDEVAPPEANPTVLDADSTQRQCIEAAARGASFVMDGPPGTGKSQTITNIIAELLRLGKRVLFVSEKAAALEVVTKRLTTVGLADFLLSLHDQRVTRRDVAVSLAQALRQRPVVRTSFTDTDLETLRARRRELSAYAIAMNEVRQPLGLSLHEVIGRQQALSELPQAPVARANGARLGAHELQVIREHTGRLSRSWGPVERGDAFVWRDLDALEGSATDRHVLERQVAEASERLQALHSLATTHASALFLDPPASFHDSRHLLLLLDALANRRIVPAAWLTSDVLDAVERRIGKLRALVAPYQESTHALADRLGAAWGQCDLAGVIEAGEALSRLEVLLVAPDALLAAMAGDLQAVEGVCAALQELSLQLLASGRRVAERFGLFDEALSIDRCEQLAYLGHLAGAPHRPLRAWLDHAALGAIEEARSALAGATEALRSARAPLSSIFEDSALDLDLEGLSVRFRTVHTGFGKLRKAYREDKALLEPHLKARRLTSEALSGLDDARLWRERAEELQRLEKKHAAILGKYYEGLETDFSALDEAITVARGGLAILGTEVERDDVAESLIRPVGTLVGYAETLSALTKRFRSVAAPLTSSLVASFARLSLPDIAPVTSTALSLVARIRTSLGGLEQVADRPLSAGDLRQIAALLSTLEDTRTLLRDHLAADQGLLGGEYRGVDTDWEGITAALHWAKEVRGLLGAAATPSQAEVLLTLPATAESLDAALDAWGRSREALLAHFEEPHATRLSSRLEVSFVDARLLLTQLEHTVDDIVEWTAFSAARSALVTAGLGEQLAFCEQSRLAASSVPGVIERSVLEGFIDAEFAGDERLNTRRHVDRESIVQEFRMLDRRLFELASARVVQACSDRRPESTLGAAGIILREAEKQRRHMPIRDLLSTTAEVAQALKPCFLMSPLTVSQFFGRDMRFDTVIFDEASQVRPCDAVNAIYRGTQLIIAGDQRQLPPTSFFAGVDADETDEYEEGQFEEFQSILDLCKGQGSFASLPLSWHYRSRHESLITYSNYSFYDGRLVTFPSSAPDGEDAGIALYKVGGIYRRGGARDNPIEADAVVDRVIEHARRHPKLTLGVVAFSEAQAAAIEIALDRRRKDLSELDDYFGGDRLNGFFVKNLENVQGDERDIIVFSVGYGPDEVGKFTLNLGPLNKPGGERRLNVAITRARQRVEIVSSVTAANFVGDSTSPGVRHLRRYLDFADRGIAALGLELGSDDRDAESPFEEEVARLLRSWGYDVVPQVGQGSYRIDLGVRDPRARGGFLLGVECDGFTYHSSKVARDRDRLRHEQLVAQGWAIHHIWSTAWYHDRDRSLSALRGALDAALSRGGLAPATSTRETSRPVIVERSLVDEQAAPTWSVPYQATQLNIHTQGLEIVSPEARPILDAAIELVIATEAPIHREFLIRRVREAWGVGRAGNRIRSAFDDRLLALIRVGRAELDPAGFLRVKGQKLRKVRIPVPGRPDTDRSIDLVPLTEIALAALQVVYEARVVGQDELTRHVARLFGWQRTGDGITARIGEAIDRLVVNAQLERVGSGLRYTGKRS